MATMMAALATCALFHWPTVGQPPAGAAGGLPGVVPLRLGAGLAQAAMATPPAPMTAAPMQQVPMSSRTPVSRAMALAVMLSTSFHVVAACGGLGKVDCGGRRRELPADVWRACIRRGARVVRSGGRGAGL